MIELIYFCNVSNSFVVYSSPIGAYVQTRFSYSYKDKLIYDEYYVGEL